MRTPAPELLPLFRSAGQARILAVAFLAPESEVLSIDGLAKQAEVSYPTTHREVGRLIKAGLFTEERIGNLRRVRPDTTSPYHESLLGLIEQAFGAERLLRNQLESVSGIAAAAIYGSFAARQLGESGQAPRDIDVLIIGEPNLDEMYRACEAVSEIVKREVNPAVVSLREWREASSGFLRNVRQAPIIPLAGDWIGLMSGKAEEGATRG